jgi:excisionase family DNA binding protein
MFKYRPDEVNDCDESPFAEAMLDAIKSIMETATALPEEPSRPVIDAEVVAERLGVSVNMIYKLIRQGKLEGYSVGRRKLVYADSPERLRTKNAFGEVPEVKKPTPRRKRAVKPPELPARRHLR